MHVFAAEYQLPEKDGDIRRIGSLYGSARGLLIADIARQHDGLLLCITNDTDTATRLESEIRFFSPENTPAPLLFADWETLPYDSFSPHQDIISQRISTLYSLPQQTKGVLIVPLSTLMHRIAPPRFLAGNALMLDTGQTLDTDKMRHQLTDAGYRQSDNVYEHGEFTIRGSIIDIFPMGSQLPYRIDLFDDEIDTLRTFDPETQRSLDKVDSIRLLPAKEFPFDADAIRAFKQHWRETFDVDYKHCPTYQDVSAGITPPGIEYYHPLFLATAPRCSTTCRITP